MNPCPAEKQIDDYRWVPPSEHEAITGHTCDEVYDLLAGPGGFYCLLTEPEDRTWWRDGKKVVAKLNEQAAEISRLAGELARVEGERDAARRAQIVRFKVEPWEDGEMVITANGAPMGGTISRSEANAACRWVASAWADLIKANNTPTPPAKEQR